MPETLSRRTAAFRMEDAATGTGADTTAGFSGWASVFHRIDSYDSLFAPTCFDRSLPEFLSKGFIAGLNHDWDNPIGAPVAARTDPAQGLFVQAEIVPTEAGNAARVLLAHKVSSGRPVIQSLSFGFRELASIDCRDAAPVLAHWASVGYTPDAEDMATLHAACARGGVRIITDVQLFEVSPVTVPGQLRAAITAARAQTPKPRDFRLALALALADLTS